LPDKAKAGGAFNPYEVEPRIKWLKEQISKL